MRRRIAGNAFWNLVSIGSGALVAVAVPPFLTRSLPVETFGAWAIVLQLASYVNLLSFGMQTVVSRHAAIARSEVDFPRRDAIVSTAFWGLIGAALLAWSVLALALLNVDRLVPALSPQLREEVIAAAMLVGAATALTLPAAVFSGVFMGLQRNEVPAIALALTRGVLAVAIVLTARRSGSLADMGLAYLAVTVGGVTLQYALWRSMTAAPRLGPRAIEVPAARTLVGEGLGLTVWNLSMLLVSGLDLIIVARLDYAMVPYFSVAATLVAFLGGVLQATSAAILPIAARLHSSGDSDSLRSLVCAATRVNGTFGLLVAAPFVLSGALILAAWVGPDYGDRAAPVLALLALASCVRLCALPYVAAAISAGLQQRMVVTPVVEGVVNVVSSIVLGLRYGALGVAMGTMIGAVVGVAALLAQHALREAMGGRGVRSYLHEAVWPLIRVLVVLVLIFWFVPAAFRQAPGGAALLWVVTGLLCVGLALSAGDRSRLLDLVRASAAWRRPR